MRTIRICVCALMVTITTASAQIQMSELFYHLRPDVVTPHISWAKPYIGGKLRALVIGPRTAQRETLELMQRMDVDCSVVMIYTRSLLGTPGKRAWERAKGAYREEVEAALREALDESREYDIIIVGLVPMQELPIDVHYKLLKRVSDGTGLVYTYGQYGRSRYLNRALKKGKGNDLYQFVTTGVPFEALPAFKQYIGDDGNVAQLVSLHRFKKGRIAMLTYPNAIGNAHFLTPNPPTDVPYTDLHYEYYQSLLIKAALWVARREPKILFTSFPKQITTDIDAGNRANLRFNLLNVDAPITIDVKLAIRSPDAFYHLPDIPLAKQGVHESAVVLKPVYTSQLSTKLASGTTPIRFRLPRLPAGTYFADVQVLRNGKRINWATTAVEVTSPLIIDSINVEPATIDLTKSSDASVRVSVRLSRTAPPDSALRIALVDSYRRVVAQRNLKVAGKREITTHLPASGVQSIFATVRAELCRNDKPLHIATAQFTTIRRTWDDFAMCVWAPSGGINEYVWRQAVRVLRTHGVDTITNCPTAPEYGRAVAGEDFRTIPYMTRYFFSGDAPDRIRKPCLTDPKYRAAERDKLTKNAQVYAPLDPLAYTLGDECFYAHRPMDLCWSRTCIASLREYVRKQYGTIERLNSEWGTNYRSFDEVMPITLKEARERKRYAHWVDHWLHNNFVFTDIMRFARDTIRQVDPNARVGFDGPFTTVWYLGYDWWNLMQVFNMCNVYYHQPEQVEQVRSFSRSGMLLGLWYGGYMYGGFWGAQRREEQFQRWAPWYVLLHDFNSVWWFASFCGSGGGGTEVGISPSLIPYPAFAWHEEEVREIKSGIGKLLLQAHRQHDGIAIHYSQPSIHLATLLNYFGSAINAQRGAMWLLEDIGVQYDFVSSDQIRTKMLNRGKYRVLILPLSQAVSTEEARAIREFVKNGGVVIADVRPGVADGHGKLWASNGMLELFGINWDGELSAPKRISVKLRGQYATAHFEGDEIELNADASVKLTSARALFTIDNVPLVIHRRLGRGAVILLNFPYSAYSGLRFNVSGDALRKLMAALLRAHDVRPQVSIRALDGGYVPALEVVRFSSGDAQFIAVLKRPVKRDEEAQYVLVRLNAMAHVYDVRRGRYLGRQREWMASIAPARAEIWAALPYRVKAIRISLPRTPAMRGGAINASVRVETSGGMPHHTVLHIEVLRPDGNPVQCLSRNIVMQQSMAQVRIPLALNDPSGTWVIKVTDVVTKLSASKRVQVR